MVLTLNFQQTEFEIFSHFPQLHNLHEMSSPAYFLRKLEKYLLSSAEFAQDVVKVELKIHSSADQRGFGLFSDRNREGLS